MPPDTLELVRDAKAMVGVGIAGMRERVRQLGGRLEIESDSSGTLIRATLPLASVGLDANTPENNAAEASPEKPTTGA